jgi:mannose-6-phosphate isomerase-like protein (cupin superfamily)
MSNIDANDVRLRAKLPFTDFVSSKTAKDLITNYDFHGGQWSELCRMETKFGGVYKRVLPIDFRDYCMLVVTKVAPGTSVPRHAHKEGIFRYVLEGSFTMNGHDLRAGDWVVVPEGMPYEIQTVEGYTVLAGYLMACEEEE